VSEECLRRPAIGCHYGLGFLPRSQNDGFLVSILPASEIEKFVKSNVLPIRLFRLFAKDADIVE